MRSKKTMLLILFAFVFCGCAIAQECDVIFNYVPTEPTNTNPPLGCPCTTPNTPYPDGSTSWCVYWDRNGNGPDAADSVIHCTPFNGTASAGQLGYFYPDATLIIQELPEAPDQPDYYVMINTTGNPACCWHTQSYTLTPGYQEVGIQWSEWTCVNESCGQTGNPPNPVTNVSASDDDSCMVVRVTWNHDHENTNGYNLYIDGIFNRFVNDPLATSALVAVRDCATHVFSVKASNTSGESATSATDHDTGSAFMLRFHPDSTRNNVHGRGLHGQSFCVSYQQPTTVCYTHVTLYLSRSGELIEPPLKGDSLVTRQCGTFPNDTSLHNLRLTMVVKLMDDTTITCIDSTDSLFDLGGTDAAEEPLLLPNRFALDQNYPNPFNPTTSIRFSVPFTSTIKVQIFNSTGQLVRTLTDAEYSSGVYSLTWDSRSDNGLPVGAGLYFCRMSGTNFTQTNKMLLLK
jgi:hypothetical protein